MRILFFVALLLLSETVVAQEADFYGCLGDGVFCTESEVTQVDTSCGQDFFFSRGRVSTPPLLAVGPITVGVQTRVVGQSHIIPVYVEIARVPECRTTGVYVHYTVLVARGSETCGGVWESIGPIDLSRYVLLGELYTIQLTFFDADVVPFARSVALSCVQVTSHPTALHSSSWSRAKTLYR